MSYENEWELEWDYYQREADQYSPAERATIETAAREIVLETKARVSDSDSLMAELENLAYKLAEARFDNEKLHRDYLRLAFQESP